jgi:UDP:flavonoid glycosyltransferase YjiC (YdhE family)
MLGCGGGITYGSATASCTSATGAAGVSRILLAWEYGRNLGHLAGLLPVSMRLKARGHDVLTVVRELSSAATMLGPAGIPFIQAPRYTGIPPRDALSVSYADLLLLQGWNDLSVLRGLLHGWVNLLRMFKPDVIVLDYAPTARLAARVLGVPCVWIGTGFTVPPATVPLPPLPGFPWAKQELAERSERLALEQINIVMGESGGKRLQALKELFDSDQQLLQTFPELDQYGPRADGCYIGPIVESGHGERVDWPQGTARRRVLAYLRPEMHDFAGVLQGLAAADAAVICYAPGASKQMLERFRKSRIVFSQQPVQFGRLFANADACVSYAPAGTVTTSLLRGVPQVLSPTHVESELTAHCVERLGAGIMLRGRQPALSVAAVIHQVCDGGRFKAQAQRFSDKYRDYDPVRVPDEVVMRIEGQVGRQ